MQLKLHGADHLLVEAITIPPLKVVAYHSAPRDHHHWVVSQVMQHNIAYPVVTGLTKQDSKTLAIAINTVMGRVDGGIGAVEPGDKYKWWENYSCIDSVQEMIGELVLEIMSSGISEETKQRFINTGELVTVLGNEMLLWHTDTVHMTPLNIGTGQYDRSKAMVSRWVFTIENEVLVKKTIPEVWVQQEMEK